MFFWSGRLSSHLSASRKERYAVKCQRAVGERGTRKKRRSCLIFSWKSHLHLTFHQNAQRLRKFRPSELGQWKNATLGIKFSAAKHEMIKTANNYRLGRTKQITCSRIRYDSYFVTSLCRSMCGCWFGFRSFVCTPALRALSVYDSICLLLVSRSPHSIALFVQIFAYLIRFIIWFISFKEFFVLFIFVWG